MLTRGAREVMIEGVSLTTVLLASLTIGAQDPAPLASFDTAWVAISRTYWDTSFVAGPWRAAHDSLRAALGSSPDDEQVRGAIRALIAVPRQSHFVLIPARAVPMPSGAPASGAATGARAERGAAGIELRTHGGRTVVWRVTADGAAARAGIRPGDLITRIEDRDLDSARRALRRVTPGDGDDADRLLTRLTSAAIGGDVGDTVRLGVQRARALPRPVSIVLQPVTERTTQFGNLPPMAVRATRDSLPLPEARVGRGARWVAVIRFSAWFPALSAELDSLLFASRGASGIVFDLRGNPGGVIGMLAGVSGHVMDSAVSLGALHGRGSTINFVANPRRVDARGARFPPHRGPVAVLTDEMTASTSEFFAAGIQATGRGRIFGERSAGQSLPALMRRLPSGDVLMHAISDHLDAAGRRIEGVGVRPDAMVRFSLGDLRTGRDPVLEAARAWIARMTR